MQQTLLLALIATAASSAHKANAKPNQAMLLNNIRRLPTPNGRQSADTSNPTVGTDESLVRY